MFSRRRFLWSAAVSAPSLALAAQEKPPVPEKPAACAEEALPEAVRALTDRRKEIVPIGVSERGGRLDLARELMKQYGMNAILITPGSSLQYYAGVRWGRSERLFAYVIPQAAAPFVICPFFERDRFADALLKFPERESTITYLWKEYEDPYIILRRALQESEITTGTLGLDEDAPFGMANMIAVAAPALKIVAATPVTAGQRSLKSPGEIALLKLANQITLDVYKAVYLSCGPGDTNEKFATLVGKAYERCGVRGEASVNVGVATASPHGGSAAQVIHEREMVWVDDGCTVDGYTSDITRSFVYGVPTDQQRTMFETIYNAQSAALAAARPGIEMRAVDAAARKVMETAGFGGEYEYFTHRLGHGIGLDMHEWPYLVGGNRQKLVAGMLFSNEPGIYLPGKFGVRLEDDMLITEKGAELLTPQSPSLSDPFAIAVKGDAAATDAPKAEDAAKPAAEAPKQP